MIIGVPGIGERQSVLVGLFRNCDSGKRLNSLIVTGRHLYSKFSEAIECSRKHRAAFNALTLTFSPERIQEWTDMINRWQEDPEHKTENPYEDVEVGKGA